MNLRCYASGSGALNFCWNTFELVGGGRRSVASGRTVTREDAASQLKPGYELFNEGTDKRPRWVQLAVIHRVLPDRLALEGRVYRYLGEDPYEFQAYDPEQEWMTTKNLSITSALRYYLRHEERILEGRQVGVPGGGEEEIPAGDADA